MGSLIKGVFKLVGLDYDAQTKAAKRQADATTAAAADAARQQAYAAQSAQQQQETAANANTQRQAAEDLLSKPVDNADVDLVSTPGDDDDDLLKRRGVRGTYQTPARNSGLVV